MKACKVVSSIIAGCFSASLEIYASKSNEVQTKGINTIMTFPSEMNTGPTLKLVTRPWENSPNTDMTIQLYECILEDKAMISTTKIDEVISLHCNHSAVYIHVSL